MTQRGYLLLLVTALLTVGANLLLRAGLLRAGGLSFSAGILKQLLVLGLQPLFVLGFVFYGAAALVWFAVISKENLSTSYPLLVSLTFVMVTIGAAIFFEERVSMQKIMGIGVILAGFVLVARG